MFFVIKIDKIKCFVVIVFLIMEGLLISKYLVIIFDEFVFWYFLIRRVGGVSEFKYRWVVMRWFWLLILVVIVNEVFCIIDYLILKDIFVILCYRVFVLV